MHHRTHISRIDQHPNCLHLARTWAAPVVAALLLALGTNAPAYAEEDSAIARGGRLYDKFFAENKSAKPADDHPSYIKGGKYGKDASWRCKECHGWDYKGKDGAYAKGGHFTGIKGIQAANGKNPADIVALLRGKAHGYSEAQLSKRDVEDLALFVTKGQGELAKWVDASNKSTGNAVKGEAYFNTICAGCHGIDGKKVKNAPALGSVADNAAEMMHKILNGQPGEDMPALRLVDHRVAADIAAYLPKLPK